MSLGVRYQIDDEETIAANIRDHCLYPESPGIKHRLRESLMDVVSWRRDRIGELVSLLTGPQKATAAKFIGELPIEQRRVLWTLREALLAYEQPADATEAGKAAR